MEYVGVSLIERSQQKGVNSKLREGKLRTGVYWQGALKQKYVKQVGVKQGLPVQANYER
jgi:hypothetical protein